MLPATITREAILALSAKTTAACVKAHPRYVKPDGLPTRDVLTAHLIAIEGFSPASAMAFAELAETASTTTTKPNL